jgi:hypothetical protein
VKFIDESRHGRRLVLYLPTFDCEWALSRWSGRPHGLTLDPLGVECFVSVPEPKRGLFGRRRSTDPSAAPYLHVLVHTDLSAERVRSWAVGQVARLGVLAAVPDAVGDTLNRLTEEESGRLADRAWTPATITLGGAPHQASAFEAEPGRWCAYLEVDGDRVALVGRALALADVGLRPATSAELAEVRAAALRV